MANAWDVTDGQLSRELTAIIASEATDDMWSMYLFKNDYTPVPGSDIGDYVPADFDGFLPAPVDPERWNAVSVVDHVAISIHMDDCEFQADPSGFVSQDIYGYYVLNGADEYVWGERFQTMQTILPNGLLTILPQRHHGVTPPA